MKKTLFFSPKKHKLKKTVFLPTLRTTTRPSRYVLQLGKCEAQYAERTSITTFSIMQLVWIVDNQNNRQKILAVGDFSQ